MNNQDSKIENQKKLSTCLALLGALMVILGAILKLNHLEVHWAFTVLGFILGAIWLWLYSPLLKRKNTTYNK